MSGTKAVEGCNTFDVSVGMNNKMELDGVSELPLVLNK